MEKDKQLVVCVCVRVGNSIIGFSIKLLGFLWSKDQFDCENDQIPPVNLF